MKVPNWCENDLYVRGSKEDLEKFKETVKGTNWRGEEELLCEDKIIPYPEHFRLLDMANPMMEKPHKLSEKAKQRLEGLGYDLTRDGFNQGGYEWCRENWGTKWGFCHLKLVEEDEEEIQYTFDTAWSPPLPLIKKLGEMFPSLEFDLRYFEGGAGFNGILRIKQGQVVDDRTGEYFGDRGG